MDTFQPLGPKPAPAGARARRLRVRRKTKRRQLRRVDAYKRAQRMPSGRFHGSECRAGTPECAGCRGRSPGGDPPALRAAWSSGRDTCAWAASSAAGGPSAVADLSSGAPVTHRTGNHRQEERHAARWSISGWIGLACPSAPRRAPRASVQATRHASGATVTRSGPSGSGVRIASVTYRGDSAAIRNERM